LQGNGTNLLVRKCRVLYNAGRNPAISSHDMKSKTPPADQDDLLRARLIEMIDIRHELMKLETLIDWDIFEREWAGFFPSHTGRPATLPLHWVSRPNDGFVLE